MNNIKERLRSTTDKLRRTPMKIADVAPLLAQAADEIERLEKLVAKPVAQTPGRYITLSERISRQRFEERQYEPRVGDEYGDW